MANDLRALIEGELDRETGAAGDRYAGSRIGYGRAEARSGLQAWPGATPSVPEGDDLNLAQAWGQPVIHVVADAVQVNAAYAAERSGRRRSAARWLVRDEG